MSKNIAIFNECGGVGKSTLTMNLGYHIAQAGKRVLLVDMDPQASLTDFMGLEPHELTETVYHVIRRQIDHLPIHQGLHGMDLLPANIRLSRSEVELVADGMRSIRLKDALAEVKDDYDFILIDCPPSLGILSSLSLVAASELLVPIQTEYKSLRGTDILLETVGDIKRDYNRSLMIIGFVPNQYRKGTVQHDSSLETINEQLVQVAPVFTPIPWRTDFANAAQEHLPLALYNPRHPVVPILQDIAENLAEVKHAATV